MTAAIESIFTRDELKKEEGIVQLVYNDKTYSVPYDFFVRDHPGGKLILSSYKNGDISEAFDLAEHSYDAKEMLEEWCDCNTEEEKQALLERAAIRQARLDQWRWRSTAIAFGVLTVAAALTLRFKPAL
ncbi:hypothetical protein AGDE_00140 [Angomonas deanei]|nr:hypothetical protein AGDE_00140 [Angomonas deanei]|eukprot:EPY43781.1 hypothetical protein AGDE_00140 [Angomonas deanei]